MLIMVHFFQLSNCLNTHWKSKSSLMARGLEFRFCFFLSVFCEALENASNIYKNISRSKVLIYKQAQCCTGNLTWIIWISIILFPRFGLIANKKMCSFLHCSELCYQYFQVLLFCMPERVQVCQLFLKLMINNFFITLQRIELDLSLKRTRSWGSEINIIVQNRGAAIGTGNKTCSNFKFETWEWEKFCSVVLVFSRDFSGLELGPLVE